MKTLLNLFTSEKNWLIVLLSFLSILILGRLIGSSYSLITNDYKIDKSKVVFIDSFQQQGRYFASTAAKSSRKTLTFKSQNGYSFIINNKIYEGCKDKADLTDKLLYHDLHFIVYSDMKTYIEYKSSKTPIGINVVQIEIAKKKYIDTDFANANEKNRLWKDVVFFVIFILILIWYKFSKNRLFKNGD